MSSLLSKQPQIDLTPYATNKHLEEVKTRFTKDLDEINTGFKKANQEIAHNAEKFGSEIDQVKHLIQGIEADVNQKLAQMFMEMEGFIKARKRDKNDQNAIIRKLRNQVEDAEKRAFYNTRAVENISTTVRMPL